MQKTWAGLRSSYGRLIVDQVPIDIMLQDESRRIEPVAISITSYTNFYTYQ